MVIVLFGFSVGSLFCYAVLFYLFIFIFFIFFFFWGGGKLCNNSEDILNSGFPCIFFIHECTQINSFN